MTEFFTSVPSKIAYEGPDSDNPLAFRWYDADRVVGERTMAEHLRFAVAYWHSFNWDGFDVFGEGTLDRPWLKSQAHPIDLAKVKMEAAFEFFEKLGAPYFCFHDADIAPSGGSFREHCDYLDEMVEGAAAHMERTGVKLLWGAADLLSHPRYQAGAATNPDPEVFAYAAAQVSQCLEATHQLKGENYVLWGGREGYETLLNTDLEHELDQMGRLLHMAVEHKHEIGFDGMLLLEPRSFETKHQYDYDVAACHAFLEKYDLMGEIHVNIGVNHAAHSGHGFSHEIAAAHAAGIFGSVDANACDVDRFPVSVEQMTLAMYEILRGGGFTSGGLNFDAKLHRQSIARDDLFHAHIGGMDTMARALLAAHAMIGDGALSDAVAKRYAGWRTGFGKGIMSGAESLESLRDRVKTTIEPDPVSGRQEMLENLVARYIERAR